MLFDIISRTGDKNVAHVIIQVIKLFNYLFINNTENITKKYLWKKRLNLCSDPQE